MFKSLSAGGLLAGLFFIFIAKFPNSTVPIWVFYWGLVLCIPSAFWILYNKFFGDSF